MKKGIIIVPFMTGFGGTETVIKNLFKARLMSEQAFELKVYSIGGSFDYSWAENVKIDIKWISKRRFLRDLYALTIMPLNIFNYLRKENPDFVISTNPVIWYLAKKSLKLLKRKTPVIAWYHYSIDQKPIKHIFLNSADYYLAISSGIKEQLKKRGISSNRIFLIFNPITTNLRLINRPQSTPHFLYIGRVMLDGQKNLRELLNALSGVKGELKLDIYGNTSQATPVKEYARKLGVDKNIIWHGFVKKPWSVINRATALILTSKYEGLPMVLCEAISHGVYCISADISTGPEDIINNYNGELYPSGNSKKLTKIIQKIIDNKKMPTPLMIQKTSKKFMPEVYLLNFNKAVEKIMKVGS
ncbi:glycosyltransferase [Limosilactobacillus reuteri]|uniref:Glycosyltransferase n=1 Tax=Limosilactobacillus reuteri TaxID=1598 RepID=A0A7L6BG42_LIMRT|nr:glycosyltransferase [Limosilactobacillus reuteri]QLQ60884.1 glycosyltransferase [Limosilactobacillus reuteri]HIS89071.1 glycosyltransferase [Candidatus Avigastranaerophilus faecigallinarum]